MEHTAWAGSQGTVLLRRVLQFAVVTAPLNAHERAPAGDPLDPRDVESGVIAAQGVFFVWASRSLTCGLFRWFRACGPQVVPREGHLSRDCPLPKAGCRFAVLASWGTYCVCTHVLPGNGRKYPVVSLAADRLVPWPAIEHLYSVESYQVRSTWDHDPGRSRLPYLSIFVSDAVHHVGMVSRS